MSPNRTPPLRAFGQRSISQFCSSNSAKVSNGCVNSQGSSQSLSDFLGRKLQTSQSPKIVQEKSRPFSSLMGIQTLKGGAEECSENGQTTEIKEERENGPGFGRDLFKLFKQDMSENADLVSPDIVNIVSEEETSGVQQELNSRKWKDPFEDGAEGEQRKRKPYLVLGDDTESKRDDNKEKRLRMEHHSRNKEFKPQDNHYGAEGGTRRRRPYLVLGGDGDTESKRDDRNGKRARMEYHSRKKESKPHYNHYANGGGWWDGDMEGVDGEEVGHSEVWEGVGSSTFGEIIDWH